VIAPHFTAQYRVMAFDLRGHGRSSKPQHGYKWVEHYAADLVEVINHHIDEQVMVVGHSLGAVVAVPIAVGAPDKVRAIVLEDPPVFAPAERPNHTRIRFEPILAIKRLPAEQRVARIMETMGITREAAELRAANLEAMSADVLIELMESNTAYAADTWLPRVSCPSLVLLGNPERGGVVTHNDRPRLKQLLHHLTLVEWSDVGHGMHVEQPQRFVSTVQAYLQNLSG
jgi:pimeloyl-ACP methyl ester carboxylesterase